MSRNWASVLLLPALLYAQSPNSGSLQGQVADASGATVSEVSVVLTNEGTGRRIEALTDNQGRYSFLDLPLTGQYLLLFSKENFSARTIGPLTLRADEISRIDVTLAVAGGQTSVEVYGTSAGVRSDSPELSMNLNRATLDNTPVLGRNLTGYVLLNSAIRPAINTGDLFMNNTLFVVNSGGRRETTYLIDGGIADEAWGRQTIFTNVPVSAVQDVDVVTNSFSAEYGRNTGSAVNVVTRAGSNDFHGELLALWRPPGIEARAPLAVAPTPDSLWQGSAALSGPIVKNRTQFSLATEIDRQQRDSAITSPLDLSVYGGNVSRNLALARIDHELNQSNLLTFRANLDQLTDTNPANGVGGLNLPSTARVFTRNAYGAQLSETATLSPNVVNQARVNYWLGSPITNFTPVTPATQYVIPGLATEGDSRYGNLDNHQSEFADTLSVVHGIQTLKIGTQLIYSSSGGVGQEYGGGYVLGQFTLLPGDRTPISQITIKDVQSYTQSFGNASYNMKEWLGSAFANDEIKLLPSFTLNLGIRYDRQGLTDDALDFAPRFGFAWNPGDRSDTVIRGGYGIYYSQIPADVAANWSINGPTGIYTFSAQPGQYGFPANLQPLTSFPLGVALPPRDIMIAPGRRAYYSQFFNVNALPNYPDHFFNPITWIGSFGVEHEFSSKWSASLDYVHQFTSRIDRPLDLNAPSVFVRTAAGQLRSAAAANATRPIAPVPNGYRQIVALVNDGIAKYDGMQFNLTRRLNSRLFLRASYTYSHAIDTVEPDVPSQTPNDPRLLGNSEKGSSLLDQRNRAVITGWYQLPFHFSIGGLTTLASGSPYNILTGVDNNGDGAIADRPVVNGALLGRNTGQGRPIYDTDLFAERAFTFSETLSLRIRAEGFNMFNHPNIVGYSATWGNGNTPNPTFGQPLGGISNTFPGREFQFSLRLAF